MNLDKNEITSIMMAIRYLGGLSVVSYSSFYNRGHSDDLTNNISLITKIADLNLQLSGAISKLISLSPVKMYI